MSPPGGPALNRDPPLASPRPVFHVSSRSDHSKGVSIFHPIEGGVEGDAGGLRMETPLPLFGQVGPECQSQRESRQTLTFGYTMIYVQMAQTCLFSTQVFCVIEPLGGNREKRTDFLIAHRG